jgi:hypothetical protein
VSPEVFFEVQRKARATTPQFTGQKKGKKKKGKEFGGYECVPSLFVIV